MLTLKAYLKQLPTILEWLIYLSCLGLVFETRWIIKPGTLAGGYLEYLTISLYVSDILLILTLLVAILVLIQKLSLAPYWSSFFKDIFTGYRLLFFTSAFLLATVLAAALISPERGPAFLKLFWISESLGLFWVVILASYNYAKLLWFFSGGLAVQALIGIWQFFTQSSIASSWLGMALHKAESLGTAVVEVARPGELPERWIRAYGAFSHPNIFGAGMALGALWCLYFILIKSQEETRLRRLAVWTLLIIFFIGLLVSFSRAAWLSFLIGFIGIFFLIMVKKNLIRRQTMLQIALILGLCFFIFFNLYGDLVLVRANGRGRLEALSNTQRIGSVKTALAIIKIHPWRGSGLAGYSSTLYSFLNRQLGSNKAINSGFMANDKLGMIQESAKTVNRAVSVFDLEPVHASFLLAAAEIGLPGALGLVLFLVLVIRAIWKAKDQIIPLAVMITVFLLLNLDHFWWSLHGGALLLFFTAGLALKMALLKAV